MNADDELNYRYFEHFMEFWIPIYRKQILNAKYENDNQTLRIIHENINRNWHLQDYKKYIFKKLGINFIDDIDSNIIKIYFKHKKKREMLYDIS